MTVCVREMDNLYAVYVRLDVYENIGRCVYMLSSGSLTSG